MIEKRHLSRRGVLALGAAAASLLAPSRLGAARAATPFPSIREEDAVIAFGHVGPVSDQGWTYTHDLGMKAVQAAFPKARTLFVESIPYAADATRIFRQFVQQGANMVFATSNFGDFFTDVAAQAPDVAFMGCDGHQVTGNMGWYYPAHWSPSYVMGVAAGLMSKTGKLGYIASFPIATVYAATNAFLMGARSVNPSATLQVIAINSWFDPQAATQAASALVDDGSDFLFGIMDEPSYLQVAEKRGVPAAMSNADLKRFGPKSYVSSVVIDWSKFYVEQVRRRIVGGWAPEGVLLPMGAGIDVGAWGDAVSADVRAKAEAVRARMVADYNPFVGELRDNKGQVRLQAGQAMDDLAIYSWDWSVDGVRGLSA